MRLSTLLEPGSRAGPERPGRKRGLRREHEEDLHGDGVRERVSTQQGRSEYGRSGTLVMRPVSATEAAAIVERTQPFFRDPVTGKPSSLAPLAMDLASHRRRLQRDPDASFFEKELVEYEPEEPARDPERSGMIAGALALCAAGVLAFASFTSEGGFARSGSPRAHAATHASLRIEGPEAAPERASLAPAKKRVRRAPTARLEALGEEAAEPGSSSSAVEPPVTTDAE